MSIHLSLSLKKWKNVAQAIKDFKLTHPIVQDNDFATWRAYNNRYWPAKYIIDKEGYIRYTHFGEGAYDETEQVIQELLKEAGASDISLKINNPTYQINAKTPEIYLGYERIDNFASPESIKQDALAAYTFPANLGNNQVAYEEIGMSLKNMPILKKTQNYSWILNQKKYFWWCVQRSTRESKGLSWW